MLPRRVIFATNVSKSSGAGHFRRLVEISKGLPASIEKHFFGPIEISWVRELSAAAFWRVHSFANYGANDVIILDSYDEGFCQQVSSQSSNCTIVQIADRYTALLPSSLVIFMDLPFPFDDSSIESRVIAHGIEYLPSRRLSNQHFEFFDQAKRVLITTGGLVNETIFAQLVAELSKRKYGELRFEFIGGYESPFRNIHNFHFHNFGTSFDSIAKDCDTAISTAGTTLWDLLASQKLVGLAAIVENQRANFEYVIGNRQAIEIFSVDELNLSVEALQTLLFDTSVRRSIQKEISGKYDFDGAKRVCKLILKLFENL
jgi:spore coat polysaccharide biosynthesis predicted glycosyltransferase SpsG